ncbi:hypothetical protein CEN44_21595 [Fischerella muscicola CCMEE 5323]|uniref:Uncharacterized protein n=1 Tax=Fischerella muscicola CCMEE 5323 TaxID=2019572 RepID=A0A2N6JY98_FISMU|nr:hypothetical protein CEN44_21595 [Fischerella muscicola CCMEE 5323]
MNLVLQVAVPRSFQAFPVDRLTLSAIAQISVMRFTELSNFLKINRVIPVNYQKPEKVLEQN